MDDSAPSDEDFGRLVCGISPALVVSRRGEMIVSSEAGEGTSGWPEFMDPVGFRMVLGDAQGTAWFAPKLFCLSLWFCSMRSALVLLGRIGSFDSEAGEES